MSLHLNLNYTSNDEIDKTENQRLMYSTSLLRFHQVANGIKKNEGALIPIVAAPVGKRLVPGWRWKDDWSLWKDTVIMRQSRKNVHEWQKVITQDGETWRKS